MEEIEKHIVHDIATIIKENLNSRVIWIPEIYGDYGQCGKALLGVLKRHTMKALKQVYGEFDHVIEITAQPPKGSPGSHAREQRMIAQSLGILAKENGRLQRVLESQDELDYYRYLDNGVEERGLVPELSEKIYEKLAGKRCLLVLEHLDQPIKENILTEMGLPPPRRWNKNIWLITTPSYDILQGSKSDNDLVLDFERPLLRNSNPIKTLLLLEASDIISFLLSPPLINCQADYITTATEAVLECLMYCFLFSRKIDTPHGPCGIQEDHLIKCWIGEGFITKLITNNDHHGKMITNGEEQQQQQKHVKEEEEEEDRASIIGKTLLEKFVSRSLLRRHSPQSHPDQNAIHPPHIEATNNIRFAYSELQSESFEMLVCSQSRNDASLLEDYSKNKKQISFIGSNRETIQNCFLLRKHPKLTTLVLRGCSALEDHIPDDFFKLINVPCLKVLDLSYTDLTYLPSSVFCLQDLMLLSLRGCSQLTTITSSSPSTSLDSSLPNSPIHTLHSLQVLDLTYNLKLESLSLNLDMPNLTDLLLVDCVSLKDIPPSSFLDSLTNLQVFCLTGSRITSFQESTFSRMESLRILDLSNNQQLVSLPGSLSKAKRLEELHVNNCKALKDIKAIGGAELRNFSLSGSDSLTTLPELLFEEITSLLKFDLQDCQALREVNAICGAKIRILSLTNIDCLTSLPDSFSEMDSLEELYVKDCRALKEIKMAGNTKIRSFFLSGSPIVQLSLGGCKNLETVNLNDLEELEVLDLSFTRVKELIFSELPKLRQFDMVGVPQLRRFPWHVIRHLPKEFNIDHCSCDPRNNNNTILERQDQIQQLNEDKVRARIFVDDPRFFCSFGKDAGERLLENEVFLEQFQVTISPCDDPAECNKDGSSKKEAAPPGGYARSSTQYGKGKGKGKGNFPYRDIYSKATNVKHKEEEHRPNRHLRRHLTVRGVDRFPPGQFCLFDYIDSLSMTDVGSLVSLSADDSRMQFLKECRLDKCHDMEYVVVANENYVQMRKLEVLWISSLVKLTVLFQIRNYHFRYSEFGNLKHVHLEHCPRLEKIFPSYHPMPSLETLTIKSCYNLREIIYFHPYPSTEPMKQRLHTIVLSELPKLLYFSEKVQEVELPALKVLGVRGCWRLRRLPLLGKDVVSEYPVDQVVEVSGERKWWEKLTWDHYDHHKISSSRNIRFKPQSNFVSAKPTVRGRVLARKTT